MQTQVSLSECMLSSSLSLNLCEQAAPAWLSLPLSGKHIAEGNKHIHLTLCTLGNQGKHTKKQQQDVEQDTGNLGLDANQCPGIEREKDLEETLPHTLVYLDFNGSNKWLWACLFIT